MSDLADVVALSRRLGVARESLERIAGDRDRVEQILIALMSLASDLDESRLCSGLASAARELARARFALCVTTDAADPGSDAVSLAGANRDDFEVFPEARGLPSLTPSWAGRSTMRVADGTAPVSSGRNGAMRAVLRDGGPVRSWLVAEIAGAEGPAHGHLVLGDPRPHRFSPRHEQLIGRLCAQFAHVLDNARLHDEREQMVGALERMLLPAFLPEIPSADVAARYRATGSANVVGGDFYDVFAIGEEEWAVLLGDVSGTGPEAAALTGIARYTVRAVAAEAGAPSAVLTELNQALLRGNIADRFCTAIYARLRSMPGGLELCMSGAGHPSPIVLRGDGTVVDAIARAGTILGAFESVALCDEPVTLAPGDVLLAYTDGVVEARNRAREQFGEGRLRSLLRSCAGRSAAGVVRRVDLAVRDHIGDRQGDDIALLAIRAVG